MAKPFLKWAGGKKWFVNQERDRLLLDFNRYIEPFLGGGSVFFYINPQQAILSDINAELVNAYICLRDEFESVYKKLHIHQIHNSEEYYYIIRDRQTRTNATSAARTIYLNKACFNGVYRVNRDGKFNVPYGKVKNLIFDRNALQESSIALRGTEILCQDFEATIDQAEQNDFIFCDPPYAVLNEDNRFVSYTANLFSWNDQVRLSHALVKHLGTCSRYQLLGNLLANTEIKKMQNKVLAIKGKMGGHEYYEFSIEPEKLLKIGYVLHRNEANKNMMPTYQRIIKRKRLKEVQSFINDGGYFPNSIIVSIDSGGRKLQFDESPTKLDDSISKIGVLHLPKRYHSAYIIDGQHRLYGYSDSEYANTNSIPIVAFVDLDRSEQLKLFMDINENQKSVSKTLRITLNSDMLWDSPNQNERRDAIRSKIAQMCGEEQSSPLLGRVVIGEDEKNNIKCITIQAIQLALQKCSFFSTFAKNNTIATNGSFDVGDNQATIDRFYPFLEGCFKTVKNECETEWSLGEQGILTINRGIQGIIRIINDVVNLLIAQNKLFPLTQDIDDIINEVEYYMSPLLNHINKLTEEQRIELKSFYGGGAENKYLHYFQKVIHDSLTDFNPEGLEEYIENTTKEYNATSKEYIYAIEEKLKDVIAESLQEYYGDKWLIKGLPKTTYKEAEKAASDKNYELLSNDEESDIEPWDCISLSDCKDIVVYSRNWSEIFESIITRPEDLILSTKEQKTEWINTISKEQNKLSKSTYSVPKSSFELISNIYAWLVGTD